MISVIVPVFNVEPYLSACIDSIISQSYTDFELILVDDGSPDKCPEICDRYEAMDKRIRTIHQENHGLSCARNTGIEVCNGQYITFIDSDDIIHKDYLKVLFENLYNYNCDISVVRLEPFTYLTDISLDSPYQGKELSYSTVDACKALYSAKGEDKISVAACGKLYNKSLFVNVRFPKGKLHEDQFTTYKVFYKAKGIIVSSKALYYYRNNSDSITRRKFSVRRYDDIQGLDQAIDFFKHENEIDIVRTAEIHREFLIIYYSLEARKSQVYQYVPKKYKRTLYYCGKYLNKLYGRDYSEFFLSQYYPKLVKLNALLTKISCIIGQLK